MCVYVYVYNVPVDVCGADVVCVNVCVVCMCGFACVQCVLSVCKCVREALFTSCDICAIHKNSCARLQDETSLKQTSEFRAELQVFASR